MRHSRLLLPVLLAAVGGCFLDHSTEREPSSVTAELSIAGVSLGEDCPATEPDARCDTDDGDTGGAPFAGDCDGPCCGSFCQQSSVTIAIAADGLDGPLAFRVRTVTLLDASGAALLTLRADTPRRWDETAGYVDWDEQVGVPSDQQVLYDLHDLDWSGITDSYSRTYRLRVEVEIGGEVRTLTSEETTREAPIVT